MAKWAIRKLTANCDSDNLYELLENAKELYNLNLEGGGSQIPRMGDM